MSAFKHPYNLRTQDVDAKVLRSTNLTYWFLENQLQRLF